MWSGLRLALFRVSSTINLCALKARRITSDIAFGRTVGRLPAHMA